MTNTKRLLMELGVTEYAVAKMLMYEDKIDMQTMVKFINHELTLDDLLLTASDKIDAGGLSSCPPPQPDLG